MACRSVAIAPCLVFSLLTGGLGACNSQLANQVGQRLNSSSTPAATPRSTAFDSRSNATTATTPQTTTSRDSNQTATSPATVSPVGQPITCEGSQHYADITWQQDQPYLRFGRLPNETMLNNVLAGVSRSPSGSVTYSNLRGETNTSVRFETDSITCSMRVIAASGAVTVDEIGEVIQSGGNPGNDEQRYWEGYNRGYDRGYQEGRTARLNRAGYNPEATFQPGTQSGNAEGDRGYRDGYFKGFSDGYNSITLPASPSPQPPRPTPGIPALW